MSVEVVTRSLLDFEPTLFPEGIPCGSLIEVVGASATEKSYLLTYLIAKFLAVYPEKRAVFVDTRNMFNLENFGLILSELLPHLLSELKRMEVEEWKFYGNFISFLSRVNVIRCFNAEDLLFCFGPKSAGQLERMLLVCPDFGIVFVDTLDNFTYCPSLANIDRSEFPDFVSLLKRSVEMTKTPAICTMNNLHSFRRPSTTESKRKADWIGTSSAFATGNDEEEANKEYSLFSNVTFDKFYFTHSLFLQRIFDNIFVEKADQSICRSEKSKGPNFMLKAHLRSRNNPKSALSADSHWVKLSIFSGILKFSSVE